MRELRRRARAMQRSCRCPVDKLPPPSATSASRPPCGSRDKHQNSSFEYSFASTNVHPNSMREQHLFKWIKGTVIKESNLTLMT